MQPRQLGGLLLCFSLVATAAQSQPQIPGIEKRAMTMYYDVKDNSFGIEVVAPSEVVREFTVCKAVRMAESKHAAKISMGNPSYGHLRESQAGPFQIRIPDGWVVLNATAYLSGQNPDRNPYLDVPERAAMCRNMFNWYR